ncbi:MAG: hypothetical protein QOI76_1570 [Frankiales bacterium]|nr:hypothetical protein [Frankiales bacterium]
MAKAVKHAAAGTAVDQGRSAERSPIDRVDSIPVGLVHVRQAIGTGSSSSRQIRGVPLDGLTGPPARRSCRSAIGDGPTPSTVRLEGARFCDASTLSASHTLLVTEVPAVFNNSRTMGAVRSPRALTALDGIANQVSVTARSTPQGATCARRYGRSLTGGISWLMLRTGGRLKTEVRAWCGGSIPRQGGQHRQRAGRLQPAGLPTRRGLRCRLAGACGSRTTAGATPGSTPAGRRRSPLTEHVSPARTPPWLWTQRGSCWSTPPASARTLSSGPSAAASTHGTAWLRCSGYLPSPDAPASFT